MSNANDLVSAMAGSTNFAPANNSVGQANNGSGINYEIAYKELESKMGTMGNELGTVRTENQGYKTFFDNLSPLLEKLDTAPEIVQAILDGKIDANLAKAAYEGKIKIEDAAVVSQASQAVSAALGNKGSTGLTPEQVSDMIEAKAREIRSEMEESADLRNLEETTAKFIEATPDFATHAAEIDKWLDEHADVNNIEVAYWAVKGKMSASAAQKTADQIAAEGSRDLMANASGGGVQSTAIRGGVSLIDQLVSGPVNPNNIF
jgi:hypothetical protein